MRYEEVITSVGQRAGLSDRCAAERATTVTLDVLGEQLAGRHPRLAARLPIELQRFLTGHLGETADYEPYEFLHRVAQRIGNGCDPERALALVRVVLQTIGELVDRGDFDDLARHLPDSYRPLTDPSPSTPQA